MTDIKSNATAGTEGGHTPGPWRVVPGDSVLTVFGVSPGSLSRTTIASVGSQPYWQRYTPEDEANAALIAAAPATAAERDALREVNAELVAALRMIRNNWAGHSEACETVLREHGGKCDCDWPAIAEQCDVALAKARDHG